MIYLSYMLNSLSTTVPFHNAFFFLLLLVGTICYTSARFSIGVLIVAIIVYFWLYLLCVLQFKIGVKIIVITVFIVKFVVYV